MFVARRPVLFALRSTIVHSCAIRSAHTQSQGQQTLKDAILSLELAGEDFYRKLAMEAPEPLDEVFGRLADEEHRHHDTLEKAFANGTLPELHSSHIVEITQKTLQNIERHHSMSSQMKSMLEVYKMARDMEATNRDKYLHLVEKEVDSDAKKIWKFLADEEQKHFKAMDQMVQFLEKAHVWYYW